MRPSTEASFKLLVEPADEHGYGLHHQLVSLLPNIPFPLPVRGLQLLGVVAQMGTNAGLGTSCISPRSVTAGLGLIVRPKRFMGIFHLLSVPHPGPGEVRHKAQRKPEARPEGVLSGCRAQEAAALSLRGQPQHRPWTSHLSVEQSAGQ